MFHIFEIFMLICFGISWPISLYKMLKAKSANGKSVTFGMVIISGYIFGIIGKLLQFSDLFHSHPMMYILTLIVYFINLVVVTIDTFVTVHYKFRK